MTRGCLRGLRVASDGSYRVAFYRVAGALVEIVLIGRKVRNALIVEGRRFVL